MISIIIPFRNEPNINGLLENIHNSFNHHESKFDVICVNDGSDIEINVKKIYCSRLINHDKRYGVGAAIDTGVCYAKYDNILICGADTRFRKQKASDFTNLIDKNKKSIYCFTNLGLSKDKPDISTKRDQEALKGYFNRLNSKNIKGSEVDFIKRMLKMNFNISFNTKSEALENVKSKLLTKRYGADILLYHGSHNSNKPENFKNIIEAKWRKKEDKKDYKIPCVLGAVYAVKKKWYNHINGFKGHRYWGTLEPYISIKSYLAGGDCRINTDIETGHIFRERTTNFLGSEDLIYNKLLVTLTTCFELEHDLIDYLGECYPIIQAKQMILKDKAKIDILTEYNKRIFKRKLVNFCKEFGIEYKMPKL
jgi:hypothetical protein